MTSTQVEELTFSKGELSSTRRQQILMIVALGTFMAPLDSSVVNIALPTIRNHFDASLATVEWVVMAYLLMTSSLLLAYGRLGDIYGHKRIYLTGFSIFTIGSFLCGIAPTVLWLIIFRGVQAVGAGMLMAMGPAIVTEITPPQERGKYLGIIAISVSVALSVGPILGGLLTAKFGWPSIFYINIPIGVLVVALGKRILPDSVQKQRQSFDLVGAVTVFIGLMLVLAAVSFSESLGWANLWVIGGLLVGMLVLAAFLLIERRLEHPMLDLTMFKNRLFSMANLSALFNYMGMFSVVFIMPFYLQQFRGMTPSQAGLLMIPMPLTTMLVAPLSGSLSDRVDTRYISALGLGILAVGLAMLSTLHMESTHLSIIIAMMIIGLGSGMFQTPNNSAIMGSVSPNRRGVASSLLATMRNLGMVLGVAVSGAVFTHRLAYLTARLQSAGIEAAQVKVQAFTGAVQLTFWVAASIVVVAIITSLVRGPLKQQ